MQKRGKPGKSNNGTVHPILWQAGSFAEDFMISAHISG